MAGQIAINPITITFHVSKDFGNIMDKEISYIVKPNNVLAEYAKENEIRPLSSKYMYGTIFMNTKNSKTNKVKKAKKTYCSLKPINLLHLKEP